MRNINWSAKYELGIEEIDLQHHYFLSLIRRLFDELGTMGSPAYRQAMFKELGLYAHFHFVSEENMMLRAAYPQLAEHKKQHDQLIDKLNVNKLKFEKDRAEAEGLMEFLQQWFLHHTLREDRKFVDFMNLE